MEEGFTPLDVSGAPLIAGETERRIEELAPSLDKAITITVVGATSGAREGVAISVARKAERPLVRIDLERCKNYLEQPWELIRELRMSGALPFVINVASSQEDPQQKIQVLTLGSALATLPVPVLVGGADRRALSGLLGSDRPSATVKVGRTNLDERF